VSLDLNIYFWIILIAQVGFFKLDMLSTLLNLKALSPNPPGELKDQVDADDYERSQEYTRERSSFGIVLDSFSLVVLIGFWWFGGFYWLDSFVRDLGHGPVLSGVIGISILIVANHLLSLPFDIYSTFVIEERFGFNRTTVGTFISDQVKGLLLGAVIGLPLLSLLLYLFENLEHAWLWGWLSATLFSLLLTYIAPTWLMPLFNKFTPLEDGELKQAIHAMARNCDFPLQEVFVIDGSRRSSKSNAFFTGFGKNKRIALFDTLIENQSTDELVAVLAHEIGHFKKKHIVQRLLVSIITTGVLFFFIGLFMKNVQLFAAFGVTGTSTWLSLIFFSMLYQPVSRLLDIAGSVWSRRHEFEADAFAAEVTQQPPALISALKKLSRDNLSNLTPHPFHVFLNYSHPPVVERIRALNNA